MLARLYLCWRWWRREDLAQILTAATHILRRDLTAAAAAAAAPGGGPVGVSGLSSSAADVGDSVACSKTRQLQVMFAWLRAACDTMRGHSSGPTATDSTSNSSGSSGSSGHSTSSRPMPVVDVLCWTEEVPELAGFNRFLAAAVGCYDDAKGYLDSLLLQHTLDLLGAGTTGKAAS